MEFAVTAAQGYLKGIKKNLKPTLRSAEHSYKEQHTPENPYNCTQDRRAIVEHYAGHWSDYSIKCFLCVHKLKPKFHSAAVQFPERANHVKPRSC